MDDVYIIYELLMLIIDRGSVIKEYRYIGRTCRPHRRLLHHESVLRNGKHKSYLQDYYNDAIKKGYEVKVLMNPLKEDIKNLKEASKLEKKFIKKFENTEGFSNKEHTGNFNSEVSFNHWNDPILGESRRKVLSDSIKKKWEDPEYRSKLSGVFGRDISINGINYKNSYVASRELGINVGKIKKRVESNLPIWRHYEFLDSKKNIEDLDFSKTYIFENKIYFTKKETYTSMGLKPWIFERLIAIGKGLEINCYSWEQLVEFNGFEKAKEILDRLHPISQ